MPEQERTDDLSQATGTDSPPSSGGVPTKFLFVMAELLLAAGIVYLFDIEGQRLLFPVMCVMIGGFAVHTWLPKTYRMGFFACLSAGCVLLVLGMTNGLYVLGIGGVLIGICYLPIGLWFRWLMLIAVGVVLIVLRNQWPLPMWPVLGSMFMFRLMLYSYSTRKAVTNPPLTTTLSYFFMAPNVCFPLFPVVDFNTFRDTWYKGDTWNIYQKGIICIVRGLTHLLLYRYIKFYLVPEPYELYDVPHVALFMVTNFALYLHVSGQFHLIAGLLHLFGFDLPRTHDRYFLASSFTDIWRRINIYWKDFMLKLFFFPTFYSLRGRGWGLGLATVVGVLIVFLSTWLLHSWQMFWLLGRFPVTANDASLWMGVGLCVAVNALLDMRRGRRQDHSAWRAAFSLSARTAGMFAAVSLFWACWTKPGFLTLFAGVLRRPGAINGLMLVLLGFMLVIILGAIVVRLKGYYDSRKTPRPATSFRESAKLYVIGMALFVALGSPRFTALLSSDMSKAIAEFRQDAARADANEHVAGYYEDMNSTAIQAGPMLASWSPTDSTQRSQAAGFELVSRTSDLAQETELIPGVQVELDGKLTTINQFGMRDRETLTLNKPTGTTRIAVVGSSVIMGYGVADDELFVRLLENRINEESPGGGRYELLNFGVGKQWASHRLVRIQRKVFGFDPDALYYFAHQDEYQSFVDHLAKLFDAGKMIRSDPIEQLINQAGITQDMPPGVIHYKLNQQRNALLLAVYRTIIEECRERGILAVWIYLPIGADPENLAAQLMPIAREAGFIVCEVPNWAKGHSSSELMIPGQKYHPHADGHAMIAEAMMKMLQAHPEALPPSKPQGVSGPN